MPTLALLVSALACSDNPTALPNEPADSARVGSSVQWNERGVALIVARPPASNGQAAVSRILSYLSLAQYRAVVAAQAAAREANPPSVMAAVGGASVAVLNSFFPLDVDATEQQLRNDLAAPRPNGSREDVARGEALGRSIGASVVAQASTDSYLTVPVGTPPTGPGMWRPSSAAIVRSLHGTRPFFLTSPSQLRAAAPPAFGSAAFQTALQEVRRFSDTRTAEQTAIAVAWNTSSGPFTAGALNLIADSVIRSYKSNELEAARILAFANTAAFDAQIACWDSKVAYWYIRPTQADTAIKLAIALPNHPSYPSGHSCITGALMGVLIDAYPRDRAFFENVIELAGMSRVYGGIHYRFDIDAGREIGRRAALLALSGSLR